MKSLLKQTSSRLIPLVGGIMMIDTSVTTEQETSSITEESSSISSLYSGKPQRFLSSVSPKLTICENRENNNNNEGILLGRNFIADAAEVSLPSVVRIEVQTESKEVGSGSGFLLKKSTISGNSCHSGIIMVVTNAHVILTPEEFEEEKKIIQNRKVKIESYEGNVVNAKLASFDTRRDLAILEIEYDEDKEYSNNMKSAEISMADIRHGEFVVALGSPFSFENSVTAGIVSNPKRKWDDMHYIQSDVSVHLGNSGGPIVNMDGKVIGITSLKVADGVSFAIPIKDAISVLKKLINGKN